MAVAEANSRIEGRREVAGREWTGLVRSLRSEIGLGSRSAAWWVGLAGLALGFELARRGLFGAIDPGDRGIDD